MSAAFYITLWVVALALALCWKPCMALSKPYIVLQHESSDFKSNITEFKFQNQNRREISNSNSTAKPSLSLSRRLEIKGKLQQPNKGRYCYQKPGQTFNTQMLYLTVVSSSDKVRNRMLKNMNATISKGMPMDYLFILHSGATGDWNDIKSAAESWPIRFYICECKFPLNRPPYVPKLYLQRQFPSIVKKYEYVWLADDDISMVNFDYKRFWHLHLTAFPSGPPVVSQPVIRQNTQGNLPSLNLNYWEKKKEIIGTTNFIEMQIPLLRVTFWHWLLPVLRSLIDKQVEMQNGWGIDAIWCEAASTFSSAHDTACGIIAVPIDHENDKTIMKSKEFVDNGWAIIGWMRKHPSIPWDITLDQVTKPIKSKIK